MSLPPERWEQVRALFDAALARPADEREAHVREAAGDDAELLREVLSLLDAHRDDDSLVGQVVQGAADRAASPLRLGARIGAYRVVERIGEGGMGTVYRGERADDSFHRVVAIKVVRGGLDSARVLERFHAERRILAALDHPHIAAVLDAGSTADGLPYLVLEHVEGQPIDRFCAERKLDVRARVELLRKVCAAVDHAHRRLVVHRDLKPANVLVTPDGTPKLLDFGIAKLLEPGADTLTATRARAMTPEYASPEQIRGEPVTAATDVHGLGLLLYEVLSGRHPFAADTRTPRELESAVLEREPRPPSTANRDDGTDGYALDTARRRALSGDLDNIVLKALAKEPTRRYPSAAELAADLDRYLRGYPVEARPATALYRAGKFLRRHTVGVAVAAAFLVTLVAAGVISTRAYLEAERSRREAVTQRDRLEEVNGFLARIFQAASPEQRQSPDEITARDLLDGAAASIDEELGDRPEVAAAIETEIGLRYRDLGFLEEAEARFRAARERFAEAGLVATPEANTALRLLGHVLRDQRRLEEARAVYEEALAESADLEPDAARAAAIGARKGLALTLTNLDLLAEAEAVHRELLVELEGDRAVADPDTRANLAEVTNDLGLLLQRSARYDEAEAELRRALALATEVHGAEHSFTAEVWANLAYVQNRAGRHGEGVESARRALEIHEVVLGPDHLQTANSRINYADALILNERYAEADSLYPLVLATYRRVYGENHPRVATAINNVATGLLNRGEAARAVPRFREAAATYAATLGDEHSWTAIARHNVARALRAAGDLDAAEAEGRATLAVRRGIYEDDHPDIARSEALLAAILRDRGRPGEAEPAAVEAVRITRATLAPDHPVRVGAERELARCWVALDRTDRARALLTATHAACDSARGGDDPLTREVAEHLSEIASDSPASR